MLSSLYSRWQRNIAQLGPLDASLYALHRALRAVSPKASLYKYYFVAQPVPAASALPPHRGRSIEVRAVAEGEEVLRAFPPPAEVIRARYRQGARCLAAFRGNKLLGYAWFTLGPYDEDEVRSRFVPLPAGATAWDFDVYVDPAERLSPAFARLWDEINACYRAQGVRWTLSRISAFNPASIAAHRRLGGRPVGAALYLVLGGWQLMCSNLPPYVHVSRRSEQRPVLHVRAPAGRPDRAD